ncbi:unnamed protein product [Prunus brigantina]
MERGTLKPRDVVVKNLPRPCPVCSSASAREAVVEGPRKPCLRVFPLFVGEQGATNRCLFFLSP